jgi:hypothetical protein
MYHRISEVHDLQIRLVSQVVYLRPEDRHAPSSLHKTQDGARPSLADGGRVVEHNDLFCLIEVCYVAILVDTASKVSRASSISGPATNKAEAERTRIYRSIADVKGCQLQGQEIAIIVRKSD